MLQGPASKKAARAGALAGIGSALSLLQVRLAEMEVTLGSAVSLQHAIYCCLDWHRLRQLARVSVHGVASLLPSSSCCTCAALCRNCALTRGFLYDEDSIQC